MEFIRKANQDTTIVFPLLSENTGNYDASITLTPGDVLFTSHQSTGWQAFAATTNFPSALGLGYFSLDIEASEINPDSRRYPTIITVIDQSSTKVWKDDSVIIRFDAVSRPRARIAGAFLTTAGVEFRALIWAEEDGEIIALSGSATASVSIFEQTSGIALFTLASGGTAPDSNNFFNLTQNNPAFTADRIYYGTVTITDVNQTYTGIEIFPCLG